MALPVLYSFRRCPYAMRARLALAASGQRCELREVSLKAKPPELLAASNKGTVPVLVLSDGVVIDQSLDIMQWALARNDPEHWLQPERENMGALQALVGECDVNFKQHLDRYKYPNRFPGEHAICHRDAGAAWLQTLQARLNSAAFLFGSRACLADFAIAPFVRQYARTDEAWFAAQAWPGLQAWLDALLSGERFERVMLKAPNWRAGAPALIF